jgi:6-phosphogluconolactonase (cycloisomerase 2 family)
LIYSFDGGANEVAVQPIASSGVVGNPIIGSPVPSTSNLHLGTLDPTNRFLYSDDIVNGTIPRFTIDPSTGLPTDETTFPTDAGPFGFVLDTTGQFALVPCANSDPTPVVDVFSIDTQGGLTKLAAVPDAAGCLDVVVCPVGQ